MDTLAVVCDDNIECGKDRDEALCRTGDKKYDPLVRALAAGTCMIYVVLKLVWFFHQRHQPFGDEDDTEDMEMENLASVSNQDHNVNKMHFNLKIINNYLMSASGDWAFF